MRYILTVIIFGNLLLAQSYALVVGWGSIKILIVPTFCQGVPKDIENIQEILHSLGVRNIQPLINQNATRQG